MLKHELEEEKIMRTSIDVIYENVHNEVQKNIIIRKNYLNTLKITMYNFIKEWR